MKHLKQRKTDRLTLILTAVYVVLLIWIVLFKLSSPGEIPELLRTDGIRALNWIPFHYDIENSSHLTEVLENIAIFIPLGVYFGMLGIGAGKTVLTGILMSLLFETTQYAFAIGAADITDLITNTAGTAIGVGGYGLLSRAVHNTDKLNRALNTVALICTATIIILIAMLFIMNGLIINLWER